MRILICSDLAPPYVGGGESYVINLASRLAKKGHKVYWLTSRLPETKRYEIYKGIYIYRAIIPFPKHFLFPGRQFFPLTGFSVAIKLAKKVDVLQFNTFIGGTFGWFVAKISKKPCVLWCHEIFNGLWKVMGKNVLEKRIYPYIERFIVNLPYHWFACPSHYTKKLLIKMGVSTKRITVIPHGIDEIFHPRADKSLKQKFNLTKYSLFGYCGRLSIKTTAQSKNLLTLLKAAKCVFQYVPTAKLVLCGTGFNELIPYIRKLQIEKNVVYVGNLPYEQLPRFYSMCDVIVGASLSEGFGFMYAEASRCGKPVVAPKTGSIPEIIIDKKTGILVKPHDSHALAKGIVELLENEEKREKMGKAGAEYTKKFNWEKSVERHLALYESLLSH